MHHEQLLSELIGIESLSGNEGKIGQYIISWFLDRGIEARFEGGNVVVHLPGKDSSRSFLFNSHMDTVSPGDMPWTGDTWKARKVGDKILGLGSSDMKAGLTSSMLLAERMAKGKTPPVDMWFTYVIMEEVDGRGSAELADWFDKRGYTTQYKDTAAIFTEPTELTEIEYGHRGNLFLAVTTEGQSGHASHPIDSNRHAVFKMVDFSAALQAEITKWQKEFSGTAFEPPTVGLLTSIQAGVESQEIGRAVTPSSINKFPSICRATFDLRTVPGFHEVALERIQELAKPFNATVELAFPASPSGYTDPDDKLVQIAASYITNPRLKVSPASADLGFFTAKGVKAIILGPGQMDQMHIVDEYCLPAQIPQAMDLYGQIVKSWADHE